MVTPGCVRPRCGLRVAAPLGMKLGQPQVQQLHLAAAAEHQVGRLDVAMHQLMFVGVLQPQRRLADDLARRADPQRAAQRRAGGDELLQVDAVDELHHQEMDAAGLARVVGPHDVRMVQPADRLHLATEAADRLGIVQVAVGKDLEGDGLIEIDLPGLVDDAHAAVAQFLQQFVVAQAARFYDPPEDALDQLRALGKSAAILLQLHEGPAPLAEVELDLQQFPQQAVALAGRGLEQYLFDQRGLARLACPFELVAHLVDPSGRRNLRRRRVVASLRAHCGGFLEDQGYPNILSDRGRAVERGLTSQRRKRGERLSNSFSVCRGN